MTANDERSPLLERLRDHDYRVTPQRRAVAEALDGENMHLTADEVLASAQRIVPEVSRATVYNALNEMVALGEVREVRVIGGTVRYDPNARVPHHLVCDHCGLIYDVEPSGLEELSLSRSQRHGMTIDSVEVTFRATCAACAESMGSTAQ